MSGKCKLLLFVLISSFLCIANLQIIPAAEERAELPEETPAAEPAEQEISGPVLEEEPVIIGEDESVKSETTEIEEPEVPMEEIEAPETPEEEEEVSDIPEELSTERKAEINEELPVPEEPSATELPDYDENEQADAESEIPEDISVQDKYSYHVVSDEGEYAVIDGYAGNDTELMIPSEMDGYPVRYIEKISDENVLIESVVIPDSVTGISSYVFKGWTALRSVTIGNGVIDLGYETFASCTSLSEVMLGNGITEIKKGTFRGCTALESITIPASVRTIEAEAFADSGLKEIIFLGDKPYFGENAFDIENVNIIYNPDTKGWQANVPAEEEELSVPEASSYVDEGTAGDHIAWNITGSGSSLKLNLTGSGNMTNYSYFNESPWRKYSEKIKTVTVSSEITSIGDYAFYGMTGLSRFPALTNVQRIGSHAFENCENMVGGLTLPDTLTYIGEAAFEKCNGLSGNLVIPDSVTELGASAFYDCTGFYGTLTLSSGLTRIKERVFTHDHFTGSLVIPDSVTRIGQWAFNECEFTGGLVIPEGVTYIEEYAFNSCDKFDGPLSLPSTLINIGTGAFMNTHFTGDLILPSGIQRIPDYTFYTSRGNGYCTNNVCRYDHDNFTGKLILPEELESIGSHAFENQEFADWTDIPSAVISIGAKAFFGTVHLIHFNFLGDAPTVVAAGETDATFDSSDALFYSEDSSGFSTPKWNGYDTYPAGSKIVEGVKITAEDTLILNGKPIKLNAEIYPSDAVNKKVTWSVNNTSFTVSQNGIVTSTYTGTYPTTGIVTCTTVDGGYTDTISVCAVSNSNPVRVTGLKMEREQYRTIPGSSVFLYAILEPFGATVGSASWSSDNPAVAAVYSFGAYSRTIDGKTANYAAGALVDGISPGRATITARSDDGNYIAVCEVVVSDGSEGMILDYENLSLNQGDMRQIKALIAGEDQKDFAVAWFSSDTSVATVDQKGNVYANGPGTAEISAVAGDGSIAVCTVNVVVSLKKIELNASSLDLMEGDTVQLSPVFYPSGAKDVELIWTSDDEQTASVENGMVRALSEGNAVITVKTADETISASCSISVKGTEVRPEDLLSGGIPDGFWIAGVEDKQYTGKAVTQDIRVYDSNKLLEEKKDYTVSYKNNKNAGSSMIVNAPSVIVTMKGSYAGKLTSVFTIEPLSLESENTVIESVSTTFNGKPQRKVPAVTVNGIKLKNGRDYIVSYDENENYTGSGEYPVAVTGIGNYTGTVETKEIIADASSYLISKALISKIGTQIYTGDPVEPAVTVKYKGIPLKEDTDYEVSYRNNTAVGKGEIVIRGLGEYVGEKTVTFTIQGIPLKKAVLSGWIDSFEYTGEEIRQPDYEFTYDRQPLKEGQDYTVTYAKNLNAGTAKAVFTGCGGFSGKVTKNFKITKTSIEEADVMDADGLTAVYAKGGAKVYPEVIWNGMILREGTDYTLKYANNKAVHNGTGTGKIPTVTITGKGNFSSKLTLNYAVTRQNLSNMNLAAKDKVYSSVSSAFKSSVTVTDLDGKKLKVGTDYDKNIVYSWSSTAAPAAGTLITATVTGKGNYTGRASVAYRIIATGRDISKAKVTAAAKEYTGRSITLSPDINTPSRGDLVVALNGIYLKYKTDYEITGYKKNINTGTALVTIRGIGIYGGEKTVSFKITKKTASSVTPVPTSTPTPTPTPAPEPSASSTPTPEPVVIPTMTPEPINTVEPVNTPESVTCGENAYESGGACYCNEGYEGDPYSGCTVIVVPEPMPEPEEPGEESGEGNTEG